jgi:hypothetical protein
MIGDANQPRTRRDALKLGGLTLSLGAVIAACGDDRGGDDDPGRVGNAPVVTEPEAHTVDDTVLLRTASSLELSGAQLYENVLARGLISSAQTPLIERLIEDHAATAEEMALLTAGEGATPWRCTNNWILQREVEPVLDAIAESDQPAVDVLTLAISFEDIAAATHQQLAGTLTKSEHRLATANAAALNSRHSAWLSIQGAGSDAYFSPTLVGGETELTAEGVLPQYAISSRFGSLAAIELIVGPEDEAGVRPKYTLRTPAENALIYHELTATC